MVHSPWRMGGAVAALLAAAIGVLVVTAAPASGSVLFVSNEAEYRAALTTLSADSAGPHVIEITADFGITGATDPQYTSFRRLTIEGNGHFITGNVSRRFLQTTVYDGSLTINDLQFSNGLNSSHGGAIAASGSVTVNNTIFTNNAAPSGGGAIYSTRTVTVVDSNFSYNTATGDGDGGAIWALGSVNVIDSTFNSNNADPNGVNTHNFGSGGAIESGGSVTVNGSSFANGHAFRFGGAIHADGQVTTTGSSFTNNSASYGGAVFTVESVRTTNTAFTGNPGGAIDSKESVWATNTTISGNSGFAGGGIDAEENVTLVNSTVSGNTASSQGGGIRAIGPVTLVHATVVGNTSPDASNLWSGVAWINSFGSVVAMPLGGGANCALTGATSSTHSYADDLSCGFDDATDDQAIGNNPQLLALANNGGPTSTRAPQSTSPLVDAIPAASCHPAVSTDQRGLPRPADGDLDGLDECDIGAVERQPPAVRPDARIKRGATGALQGDNVYNTLTGQTVNGAAARGRSVTYYLPVQNDAAFTDELLLKGQPSTTSFTVVYRSPAGADITGMVTNGTYTTGDLAAGAIHQIRAVVTVRSTAPAGASVARTLTAISTTRPTIRDTVRFVTSRS